MSFSGIPRPRPAVKAFGIIQLGRIGIEGGRLIAQIVKPLGADFLEQVLAPQLCVIAAFALQSFPADFLDEVLRSRPGIAVFDCLCKFVQSTTVGRAGCENRNEPPHGFQDVHASEIHRWQQRMRCNGPKNKAVRYAKRD